MNNLHRQLTPISEAAWAQIEEETSRTIKRYLAGRRVADVHGPAGTALAAVATGHQRAIEAPGDGITSQLREAKSLVELRVPFELDRQMVNDVERGANDSDWQPAKDAARKLAFAEDRAIFEGYPAAGIVGVRQGTSNPKNPLPADVRKYPEAFAQALGELRLVGAETSAVGKVSALSDLDNVAVGIADVTPDLPVLGDGCGDEFRASTFPQLVARLNIRNADIHEAVDVIRVGGAERYRRLVWGRAATDVQNHPDIREQKVRRSVAVAHA